MSGRLECKRIAILGAGQTRGDPEGNDRAMARIFSLMKAPRRSAG